MYGNEEKVQNKIKVLELYLNFHLNAMYLVNDNPSNSWHISLLICDLLDILKIKSYELN
jgi:hypothetical protein